MTQTGKCDVCRLRKVKCDENQPTCGQCSRKDRPCSYTYGKLSAVVVEDPNEYTSYGRSKTTPVVYPIRLLKDPILTGEEEDSTIRLTMEKEAENGAGIFLAFEPAAKKKRNTISKKRSAAKTKLTTKPLMSSCSSTVSNINSRRTRNLARISAYSTSISKSPESPESTLVANYIHLFFSSSSSTNPLSILGSWITSIPSRMSCNPTLYLAVEFAVNAFLKFVDPTSERTKVATQSKAKALKSLKGALKKEGDSVEERGDTKWDLVMATKLHFGAECLMNILTCYHTIHANGLTEMLKSGPVDGMEEQYYWDFVDNTYIDEVGEAMMAGRLSSYDNSTYLTLTSPLVISTCHPLPSPFRVASMLVMNSFIQMPRLACLVRHAVAYPQDEEILSSAISLAGELWALDPSSAINTVFDSSTTVLDTPPCPSIADIIPTSLHFESIQIVVLLTRYWMLRNILCGILETMYKHFPALWADAFFPSIDVVRGADKDAAVKIAQSVPYCFCISPNLPLVSMRLLVPLGISMGIWYRAVQRLEAKMAARDSTSMLDLDDELVLENARRMRDWVGVQGNIIYAAWGLEPVLHGILEQAVDVMAGEEIPAWLPRRVRFEEVGEEMVMRLEYQN